MGGHLKRLLFSSWSVNKHGHYRQFLFLVGRFLKTFSETAWSNKTNFTRIIYGSSFIRFLPFSRWDKQTCLLWGILVSDWLKLKKIVSSKTRSHNELLLCYFGRSCTKFPYFGPIIQLVAAIDSSCLWLAN
jgi:hypothetical protein